MEHENQVELECAVVALGDEDPGDWGPPCHQVA